MIRAMPDRRQHRGRHPADEALFAESALPRLRTAVSELSWLLTRGYSDTAALKLVGDRHRLVLRQRHAVVRCACTDEAAERRPRRRLSLGPDELAGKRVAVDGFNCLITVEAALSGGIVLVARDGAHRDLSSLHGSYRKIEETLPAVRALGRALERAGASATTWHLDRPVSNSGRLRALLLAESDAAGWSWDVVVGDATDRRLIESGEVVATGDGFILDRCETHLDLPGAVLAAEVPDAWVVDLREPGAR
jgi:hypothetical protein